MAEIRAIETHYNGYYCFVCKEVSHSISAVSDEVLSGFFYVKEDIPVDQTLNDIKTQEENNPYTFSAFQKARSARFEFGENG